MLYLLISKYLVYDHVGHKWQKQNYAILSHTTLDSQKQPAIERRQKTNEKGFDNEINTWPISIYNEIAFHKSYFLSH